MNWKEAAAACAIALGVFLLSNIQFAIPTVQMEILFGNTVMYTRTLADFGGLMMLAAYSGLRRQMNLESEVKSLQNILDLQYEQYLQFENNSDTLRRMHHDMKHQIAFLRAESDEKKREGYLQEMEQILQSLDSPVRTGNSVLDTLLTSKRVICQREKIAMSCYVDGECLAGIDVMDLCSIFGNALDNAIQYEKKLPDPESRLIRVSVKRAGQLAVICIENYCAEPVALRNGLPVNPARESSDYHGYGAKSIRHAVQKYGGNAAFLQNGDWFTVKALVPV